ncbi:uncharacterized protein [Malus domestica]|uniref:uncharacterized protein n=1 Tax=Malus domestica TaxID=3750 RepID=UPI003974F6AA
MFNFVFNFLCDVQLCGNGYILQQQRVISVCYFAKEASCSVLKEDDDVRICRQGFERRVFSQELKLCLSVEKQEITIEKAMRNKRKCITTVKGMQLFGDSSFLFFGAFVCTL